MTRYPHSTSGSTLLQNGITELPTIINPIFPKIGVCALAGESDSGKSSLLRTLAIDASLGNETFLGWTINATHNSVLYVSSEDDEFAMSYLLNKQASSDSTSDEYERLRFIFDTENIIPKIREELEAAPADIVIIDAFTDVFPGEINANIQVRNHLNIYANLAKRHECLIIFLHHSGKRTQNRPPSKDNLIGSQGFEAKMRMVIELRKDPSDNRFRHLCIVKGNYLDESYKTRSFKLEFLPNLTFRNTGERTAFEQLMPSANAQSQREPFISRARELRAEGLSITVVHERLEQEGCTASRSTVHNWLSSE